MLGKWGGGGCVKNIPYRPFVIVYKNVLQSEIVSIGTNVVNNNNNNNNNVNTNNNNAIATSPTMNPNNNNNNNAILPGSTAINGNGLTNGKFYV